MKFIITEEQNIRLQILRRLDEIWGIIRNSYPFVYPCDYHGLGHFAIALKAEFSYIDSEGFFRENANEICDIVSKIYAKKIKERYDESNCDGESVIEESDSHEQKEWKRFEMFMRRRGEQIRDLILKHSQDYKRSNSNYGKDVVVDKMFELVVADFCDINKIGYDDKEYDWVYFYLQDNYTDYIKDELFLWNKDTITESQLLSESDPMLWVKRRLNKNILRGYITDAEMNYPTLCTDFEYDWQYMDEVIGDAVSDFLTTYEEMFDDYRYEEINEIVTSMCYDWFGDDLKEIYKMTCEEYNK